MTRRRRALSRFSKETGSKNCDLVMHAAGLNRETGRRKGGNVSLIKERRCGSLHNPRITRTKLTRKAYSFRIRVNNCFVGSDLWILIRTIATPTVSSVMAFRIAVTLLPGCRESKGHVARPARLYEPAR